MLVTCIGVIQSQIGDREISPDYSLRTIEEPPTPTGHTTTSVPNQCHFYEFIISRCYITEIARLCTPSSASLSSTFFLDQSGTGWYASPTIGSRLVFIIVPASFCLKQPRITTC